MASKVKMSCPVEDWLEEDGLMLLECWARDGYTLADIANKIGVHSSTLSAWQRDYPEIKEALKRGKEIIDYKVENALLKSALGYKTKEVKVTTTIRYGKVVETIKETTDKEQAPNVSAIQCWLYNRRKDKWKNMNSKTNILDDISNDTEIKVTVTRASKNEIQNSEDSEDKDWEDEVNESITIRKTTPEEKEQILKEKRMLKQKESLNPNTKIESEPEDDLDYWPDDWEDEDEQEE